jgi:hypothetical protein
MESNFSEDIKSKSGEELKEIILNYKNYDGELVHNAKEELANRGIEITSEEKQQFEESKYGEVYEKKLPIWLKSYLTTLETNNFFAL